MAFECITILLFIRPVASSYSKTATIFPGCGHGSPSKALRQIPGKNMKRQTPLLSTSDSINFLLFTIKPGVT